MKSLALVLISAAASAVEQMKFIPTTLVPEQQRFDTGIPVDSSMDTEYEPVRKIGRQMGRFVDLCPNAGKCDFSPDQKIGGEIIELDSSQLGNIETADLGSSKIEQQLRLMWLREQQEKKKIKEIDEQNLRRSWI